MAEVSSSAATAATTANVVKDITEIYSRLFDHKPFLQGEIKFFVKEFEEKRGDREVQRLFEMLEDVTEVRETQIDRACRTSDQGLCSLAGNLEVALSMCHRILEAEDKVNSADDLSERRERRRCEWDQFEQDVKDKVARMDQAFEEKERELIDHYRRIREKLQPPHKSE
ncbi:biogenesis of lysosome-related organelles complex 1 subunit 5 [Rhipicephalus sanguineus]|uniref:biogenesis of lysosome-related organelles complex 1 subunit 5 n=1 Tax=Rhipicephalus sanguineus TaxID=34632 RepID=UPI001894F139|nr:biogenesis of lysosome-related organelles complex 1 subunit 5 [Rhipicephalus sanguineus]